MCRKLGVLKEGLGVDVWDRLKESSLGVFIKFAELEYTWAALRVHYLLTEQLAINNIHEVWSLIDDRPLRFSLHEFADITRLNCDAFDPLDNFDVDHHAFWAEMKIPTTIDGPMYSELLMVLDFCKTWSFDKRLMVGRLCLLSVCVHGIHHTSRIPLATAKRALDSVAFEKHPWGRVAFSCLVNSIKIVELDKDSYTIQGCVHAMLIWMYESITGLGETYGFRRADTTGVPLLDWRSSRKRIDFTKFIKQEKELHGQVRVRHMVHVLEENMYPLWCDTNEIADPNLDELIKDLIHNRLAPDAWRCVKTVGSISKNKKRRLEADKENDDSRTSHKKKRATESCSRHEEGAKKRVPESCSKCEEGANDQDGQDEQKSLLDIWRAIEKMNETISELGKSISTRMDALESKFEAVEGGLKEVKEKKCTNTPNDADTKCTNIPNDATSNTHGDEEGTSKEPSWIVEMKNTSHDEFPVQRVVKKVYTVNNKKKEEGELSENLPLVERKDDVKAAKKKNVKRKLDDLKCDDIEDITTQYENAKTKMASSSEDTWSNKEDQLASKQLKVSLKTLGDAIKKLDEPCNQPRRVPQLAGSQKLPYVGNSTVKRIITDIVDHDHLKPVDDEKHQSLLDFLGLDKEAPLTTNDPTMRFYWQLMTPRDKWPSFDYGWLKDHHMRATMAMFRRRYMRDPCPYPNQRIAFLDPDLIRILVKDYKQFEIGPKNFVFRNSYVDHFNGTAPTDSATNKKWWIDADNLYACLFVNGNHWVALDIDLPGRKIFVYDSIPTLVSDDEMATACLPLRRMIPAMLSDMIPKTIRKKSRAMLEVKRVKKNVPLNENPGDCGMYVLKYIECLALRKKFDGLHDDSMLALRIKLAAELHDEVFELSIPPNMSSSYPCLNDS